MDINNVTQLLRSSKIKDRNDALNNLESIASSKFNLGQKPFRLLIQATFDLIEYERIAYYNNKSNSVEFRLSKASEFLRVLTEKSLDNDKIKITSKSYLEIVKRVIENFRIEEEILIPCSIDFSKILVDIIRQDAFKDHLVISEWKIIYNFVVDQLDFLLNTTEPFLNTINETIFIEIYNVLQYLISCENSISINYLQLLCDTDYTRLLILLQKTFFSFRKENILIITLYKILNKVIIITSTENEEIVFGLVLLGIRLSNSYYQSQWESLQVQLLTFLNLPIVHKSLSMGVKIDSQEILLCTSLDNSNNQTNRSEITDNILLYHISSLISNISQRAMLIENWFDSNDIGLILTPQNNKKSWFQFNSIFLKSKNYKPWLLNLGLSYLITSYFNLKLKISQNIQEESLSNVILETPNKKQKLDIITESLNHSNSILEFCNNLIMHKTDNKIQILGLQVLSFYTEFSLNEIPSEAAAFEDADKINQSSISQPNIDTFKSKIDISIILENVIGSFENPILHYWVLISSRAMLFKMFQLGFKISNKTISPLMKVSLSILNDQNLSNISSNIVYLIVIIFSGEKLAKILDKSLITQINNLIDLSEINGPFFISNESFQLWYSIYIMVSNIIIGKKDQIISRIQQWLLFKWDSDFKVESDILNNKNGLPSFIAWLCGFQVKVDYERENRCGYIGFMNQSYYFVKRYSLLSNFINLVSTPINKTPKTIYYMDSIGENKHQNLLLMKVTEHMKIYSREERITLKLKWTILCLQLLNLMRKSTSLSQTVSILEYQCTNIFQGFADRDFEEDELFEIIGILNSVCLETIELDLFIKNFPFSQFFYTIKKSFVHSKKFNNVDVYNTITDSTDISVLDDEFGSINHGIIKADNTHLQKSIFNPTELIYEDLESVNSIKVIYKYMPLYTSAKESVSFIIDLMCEMNSSNFLYCLNYLTENLHFVDMRRDMKNQCWKKLIRFLGHVPLVDAELERAELTFTIVSKFSKVFYPIILDIDDIDLKKDYFDICNWLIECGKRNLILTEISCAAFCQFLFVLFTIDHENVFDKKLIKDMFFEKFYYCTNNTKIQLVDSICIFMKNVSIEVQMDIYRCIYQGFRNIENSKESGATYGFILSSISSASSHLMLTSIFNLLEYSNSELFFPYLNLSLKKICFTSNTNSPFNLFKKYRIELLIFWWMNYDIELFPFSVFEYESYDSFINDNYEELTAIGLSINSLNNSITPILSKINTLKATDEVSVICDSLRISIPLSFTKDGVRNEIFEKLQSYLGKEYKYELMNKLLVTVLSIIQFMDMTEDDLYSQGNALSKSFYNKFSKYSRNFNSISFSSGTSLLEVLIGKFYNRLEEFWSLEEVYFLIRQISILINKCESATQILNLLRKIKFILIMGQNTHLELNVIKLLILIVSSYLNNDELRNDLYYILSVCQFQILNRSDDTSSLSMVVKLISSLMSFGINSNHGNIILNNIENYVNNINSTRKVYPILVAAVEILKGNDIKLKSSLFTSLLSDEAGMRLFYNNEHSLISLFSNMFVHVEDFDETEMDYNVVKTLCKIEGAAMKSYSYKFKSWSAKYLSNYYLTNPNSEISNISNSEYDDFTSNDFEHNVLYLDELLKGVIDVLEGYDFEVSACAESILGVFLWRYKKSKTDVLKFFNFELILKEYKGHIKPIDFHACLLLNSNNKSSFFDSSLSNFIKDIHLITLLDFEIWTSKLLLALIQELSIDISIIPVFSNFILKVPTFAAKIIPFLICFYVNFKGKKGIGLIVTFINKFIELKLCDDSNTQLISRIVLSLRIGSKKRLPNFQRLENQLNLNGLISISSNGNLNKSSLMLFEDYYSDSKNSQNISNNIALLRRVYTSINDEDLIYGLPIDTSLDHAIDALGLSGNGTGTIQLSYGKFDTNLSFQYERDNSNILESLMKDGVMGISRIISKELPDYKDKYSYEWSWRLNSWDMPVQKDPQTKHAFIYKALKQIHESPNKAEELNESLLLSLLCNKDKVFNVIQKSGQLSNSVHDWLQTLAVISSILQILKYDSKNMMASIDKDIRLTSWIETSDPIVSEVILLARQATYGIMAELPSNYKDSKSEYYWLGSLSELIRLNEQSRISNRSQKMVNSAITISEIAKTKFKNSKFCKAVENISKYYTASTLWKQGQTKFPVEILKSLQEYSSDDFPIKELSISTSLIKAKLASWTSESRQELANNIMDHYIFSALKRIDDVENLKQHAAIYLIFANFCEGQLRSRHFIDQISRLEKRINAKRSEIDEMKIYYGNTSVSSEEKRSVQKYYSKLKSSYLSDISDLEAVMKKKNEFADNAVEFYLKCISTDTSDEEELDKFISLWLEFSANDDLNTRIELEILSLPTFKFISWCNQLISRLSKDSSSFQSILRKVIVKLCQEHPFHSLYFLISLRIHDSNESNNGVLKSKYNIANMIWSKLLSISNEKFNNTLISVEKFCNEIIELAAYKVSRSKSLNLENFEKGEFWINGLPSIPAPTSSIPINYTKCYEDIPYVVSVEKNVSIATSGLSLPKIVTFLLSNGFKHKVLLKYGTDDLRQDSIMEQVFEKVNNFFMKDRETRKRNLRIRTYKAVPLGPQAGIIEFVPSSVALIDAIKPYHINKDKIKLDKARDLMKHYQGKEASDRIDVYNQITSKIEPVLRYFFFDNFITPDIWFNSRQKFTRGLATTSMVGHILGLGDRHCNNILLDKISGEPIHIDLGVSFDQGKRLPIPETVPFRLTRDLVDGLGITGIEGGFKISSEHTFRVLRENKDHILAILDVLKWDPLYSWSISPIRKKKLQDEGAEVSKSNIDENTSEAWNAINSVSDKLIAEGLSVEAVVRELIQDATNPANLALIYFGWCPFF